MLQEQLYFYRKYWQILYSLKSYWLYGSRIPFGLSPLCPIFWSIDFLTSQPFVLTYITLRPSHPSSVSLTLYPPLPLKADSFWFRSDTLFTRLFVVPGMPHTLWLCRLVRVVSALLQTNKVSTWMCEAHANFSGRTCRIHPPAEQSWVYLDFVYIFYSYGAATQRGSWAAHSRSC